MQPAAAEVGPAPFSQPWAALPAQLGTKLQPQTTAQLSAFCKCLSGATSLHTEGKSPQVADTSSCGVLYMEPGGRARRRNLRQNFKISLLARWCDICYYKSSRAKRKALLQTKRVVQL